MSRIILFDGGKAGGILMDEKSVRAIPRFAPEVLANLAAVSGLLRAAGDSTSDDASRDLISLANKVSNIAVERVEAAIGRLDADNSLVYLSDDDGFVCGSSGAPPRSISWPPRGGIEPRELLATNVLSTDLIEFLARTSAHGTKLAETLEDPHAVAKQIHFKLSTHDAQTLKGLAPSQLQSIRDPVEREVVSFFHAVIEDGRFLEEWSVQPVGVSESIHHALSNEAVDRILGGSALVGRPGDVANLSIEQGIVVGVVAVVLVVAKPRLGENVLDRSGIEKF